MEAHPLKRCYSLDATRIAVYSRTVRALLVTLFAMVMLGIGLMPMRASAACTGGPEAKGPCQGRAHEHCVVPPVVGDSLNRARRALLLANCKLGRVSRPSGSRRLVVTTQSPRPSRKLADGARVSVTLGPPKRKHPART